MTRRTLLGAGGAAALAGGAGVASAQSEPYGGWFTGDARGGETASFDGTVDRTGESEVTVDVGAPGNGGTFAYAPTAVRVDPGTTVRFTWSTDNHNVVVESQPDGAGWEGHEPVENTGFEFTHTFETEGVYTYFCQPHLSVGMKGAVVVGDADVGGSSGGGGGTARPDFGDWLVQDGEPVAGGYTDARGQSEVTVDVGAPGNGGTYAFAPANLWIDPGTTVRFTWSSDNHNAVVESQPDDAGWEGHEPVENTGFEFTHTFETGGMYEYYCQPHLSLGMKAGIAVGDDVPTRQVGGADGGDGGGGGGPTFQLPSNDIAVMLPGLVFGLGGLLGAAILAGELYNDRKQALEDAPAIEGPATEAPAAIPTVEIGHDEYDPVGTAILIAGFFLVLVFMWIFVYFVEFLGNGPTIVG